MCGAHIGIFLPEIILCIAVIHRLELNLKAVVSRRRWGRPQHGCGCGTVGPSLDPEINSSGADRDADSANSELEKREGNRHVHDRGLRGIIPDLPTTSYVVPGWRAEEEAGAPFK